MLGSLTVLPALLSALGDRVDAARIRPGPVPASARRAAAGSGARSCGARPAPAADLRGRRRRRRCSRSPRPRWTCGPRAQGIEDLSADARRSCRRTTAIQRGVPRRPGAGRGRRQGARPSAAPTLDGRAGRLQAAGPGHRAAARAGRRRGQPGRHGRRRSSVGAGRHRQRPTLAKDALDALRDDSRPGHPRAGRRRLGRASAATPPASMDFNDQLADIAALVFGFVLGADVPADAGVVPLGGRRGHRVVLNLLSVGRRVRHAGRRLPARPLRVGCWTSEPRTAITTGCRCSSS